MTEKSLYSYDEDMTAGQKLFNAVLDLHTSNGEFTKGEVERKSGVTAGTVSQFINAGVDADNIEKVGERNYSESVYKLKLES